MINLSLASPDSNPKEVAPQQPTAPVVSGSGYRFRVARLLNPYRYLHLPSFNPYNYFPSSYLPTSAPQLPMQKLDGKELDIATSWQLVDSQDEGDKSEDKEVDISISRPLAVDSTDEFANLMRSWELLGDDKGGGEKVDDKVNPTKPSLEVGDNVNSSKPSLEVDAEALDKESIKLLPTPVERAKEAFAKLGEENFPGMQPDELARRRLEGERALALLFHKAQANEIRHVEGFDTVDFWPNSYNHSNRFSGGFNPSASPFFSQLPTPFLSSFANAPLGDRKVSAVVADDRAFGITRHRLGQGAVKTVKAAFDLADGSLVARAIGPHKGKNALSPEDHDYCVKQLDNEIDMLKRFKGEKEFIQIIHSYKYDGKNRYGFVVRKPEKRSIIMERAELDLEHFLDKSKKVGDLQQAAVLFHDILVGIVKMQDRNIIHRDIKPANILLKATEKGYQAKIADFDAAIEVSPKIGIAGTPAYWSPEILLNQGKKTPVKTPLPSLVAKIERLEVLIGNCHKNFAIIERRRNKINENQTGTQESSATLKTLAEKEAEFREKLKTHEENLLKYKEELAAHAGESAPQPNQNPTSIVSMKTDVWAYAVMLYELLYGKYFLTGACTPIAPGGKVTRETLPELAKKLDQHFVDGLLAQGFNSDVQQKMNNVLKQALVVDASMRPDARGLYAIYCKEFNLDPQV